MSAAARPAQPEPDAAPASLDGLRVVLDAHGSDRGFGTGLSTYARTLHAALASLNADASWLFGRDMGAGDALEREVSFVDPPTASVGLRRSAGALARAGEAVLSGHVRAPRIPEQRITTTAPGEAYPRGFNGRGLFRRANFRHEFLGLRTEVSLAGPCDVFHMTVPLPIRVREARNVVTIHDLIPLRLPTTTPDDKLRYLRKVRRCAQEADLVLTVSEASRSDILEFLDLAPEKVVNTYQTSLLQPLGDADRATSAQRLSRHGLKPGEYALFIGALEPKKNLARLLRAFLDADTSLTLAVAGPKAWFWEKQVEELGSIDPDLAARRIRFLGYVPDADLPHLLDGAAFLAFPSLMEGFGLPALEAMRCGCPVLTSRTPALEEVTGGAALLVDPHDEASIRSGIETLAGEESRRTALAAAGLERAAFFSMERYRRRLFDAYARLM
ncbi:MAG: glycosyltransferase family 1 protein [Hyphomonadaceae bacterium]